MLCTSVRVRPGRALALMVGAAVLWGTVGVVVRELHDDAGLSAERVAWLRSLVAAAALGLGGVIARRGDAAVTLLMRARAEHLDRGTLTGGAFAVGAVVLLPFALRTADGHYDAEAVALIAFLGVVASALGYLMFFVALRDLGGTASAVAVLLEPLTAGVLAWLLLGESLGPAGIAGGVLLLGAVAAVATDGDG